MLLGTGGGSARLPLDAITMETTLLGPALMPVSLRVVLEPNEGNTSGITGMVAVAVALLELVLPAVLPMA